MSAAHAIKPIRVLAITLCFAGLASAQIIAPQPPPLAAWDPQVVADVVSQLKAAAERARLRASEQTHPGRSPQSVALADLTTIAIAAQHYVTQLQQSPNDPAQTRQDYVSLTTAYARAQQNLPAAEYDASVMQEFARIGSLLDRLSVVYTQQWDREVAKAAAEVVHNALTGAFQVARQKAHADSPADQRALFLIQRLSEAAGYMTRQLDLDPSPIATAADFRLIVDDYVVAMRSLRPTSFNEYVQPELRRAGEAMGQLRRAYDVPWNGANARTLADEFRSSAQQLMDQAARGSHLEDLREALAFDGLIMLVRAAENLTRQLQLRPDQPLQTYPDFLVLVAAYEQSSLSLTRARLVESIGGGFNRLEQQIIQLYRMYWGALDQAPARLTGTVIGR